MMPAHPHASVPASTIKVLLVDDHRSVLWGLERLIESVAPRMQVVASVTHGVAAMEALVRHQPDVVLLDLDLGNDSGLSVLERMLAAASTNVLILSGLADAQIRQEAIRRGARGMVHKSESAEVILKAVERVNEGEMWVDRATAAQLLTGAFGKAATPPDPRAAALAALTPKEREIIAFVVRQRGASNKVMADTLCISAHTLRNHLAAIYGKLDVHSRLDLYMFAQEQGLG